MVSAAKPKEPDKLFGGPPKKKRPLAVSVNTHRLVDWFVAWFIHGYGSKSDHQDLDRRFSSLVPLFRATHFGLFGYPFLTHTRILGSSKRLFSAAGLLAAFAPARRGFLKGSAPRALLGWPELKLDREHVEILRADPKRKPERKVVGIPFCIWLCLTAVFFLVSL